MHSRVCGAFERAVSAPASSTYSDTVIVGIKIAREPREGETSITSDETRGNKRPGLPRTRITLQSASPVVFPFLSPFSLSITLSRLRPLSSWTRNEIMSDVLDATELFTSSVIRPLYSTVPYSTSVLPSLVRYCVYISWRSSFLVAPSIKRIVPSAFSLSPSLSPSL